MSRTVISESWMHIGLSDNCSQSATYCSEPKVEKIEWTPSSEITLQGRVAVDTTDVIGQWIKSQCNADEIRS